MKTTLTALLAALLLAACGGDDDGGDGGGNPGPGEPNESIGQATPITVNTPVQARITSAGDRDFYAFTVPAGGATVRFRTFDSTGTGCDAANGRVDPFLEVYDAAGTFRDEDDDSGAAPLCEDLSVALAAGTNYVVVGGYPPVPFDYTLLVSIE